jgi:polar amino acid transport system substrate-binding protein
LATDVILNIRSVSVKVRLIRFISLVIASLFIIAGCGNNASRDKSLEQIRSKGYFIVGLDDQFPPMGFRGGDNNEIMGFDIDLAKEAAKRLRIAVQFRPVAWDGIIYSLNKGDIDAVWNGMSITDDRKQKIEFSKPYLNNRQIIMVRIDSPIKRPDDLKGRVAGIQLGSSSETALSSDETLKKSLRDIRKYENNTLALMDLYAGRVDAVIIDETVGRWNMAKKPGSYKILDQDLGKELYGVGMRKTDLSFRDALDRVLDEIKNDSTGEAISKKWFGENILLK